MKRHRHRAMDLVAIALVERTGRPFWLFRGDLRDRPAGDRWALGGPVGVGTVFFLVFVGFLDPAGDGAERQARRAANHALPQLHEPAFRRVGDQAA